MESDILYAIGYIIGFAAVGFPIIVIFGVFLCLVVELIKSLLGK